MHETSVLENVLKTCRKIAEDNNVQNIKKITLSVGELTGYIPHFFSDYFPIITKGESLFENTELNIKIIKGEALCEECGAMYNVMKNEGKCPKCNSMSKTIIGGQDFVLDNIEV